MKVLSVLPAILITAILLDILPRRARRGIYFGVTTGHEFAFSEEGRRMAREFRLWVWLGTALGIVAAWAAFAYDMPGLLVAGPLPQIVTAAIGWTRNWKKAKSHAITVPPGERVAPLTVEPGVPVWGWLLVALSVLLPLLAAGVLAANYDRLPDRYPVHYGPSGQADGFRPKSAFPVFGPLGIGMAVLTLMYLTAYGVAYGTRRGGSPDTLQFRTAQRRFMTRFLLVLGFLLSLLFSYIALAPMLGSISGLYGGWIMIGFVVLIVGASIWAALRWNEMPSGSGDDTPDDRWKAGIFYYNPDDPALMVEKRDGIGYTVNMARPAAWLFVGVILATVAGSFLIAR